MQLPQHLRAGISHHIGNLLCAQALLVSQNENATAGFAQFIHLFPETVAGLLRHQPDICGVLYIAGFFGRSVLPQPVGTPVSAQESADQVFAYSEQVGTQSACQFGQTTRLNIVHHQQECILEKVFQVCSIDGVVFDAPADKLWTAVGINGFAASLRIAPKVCEFVVWSVHIVSCRSTAG